VAGLAGQWYPWGVTDASSAAGDRLVLVLSLALGGQRPIPTFSSYASPTNQAHVTSRRASNRPPAVGLTLASVTRAGAMAPPPPPVAPVAAPPSGVTKVEMEAGSARRAGAPSPVPGVSMTSSSRPMCIFAFDALLASLRSEAPPPMPTNVPDVDDVGLFVTWNKRSTGGGGGGGSDGYRLRGCIGTLTPSSLHSSLATYAVMSAVGDRRFPAVTRAEVSSLSVSVSVLSAFEEAADVYDWTVGVHGIIVSFEAGNRSYRATYLPEVMGDMGWDKGDALASAVRKAGWSGRTDDRFWGRVRLRRYQSTKVSLPYGVYARGGGDNEVDTSPSPPPA